MASAVRPPVRIVAPQFSAPPPLVTPLPVGEPLRQAAAAGQFRAIALWLNQALTPVGLYAQVQEDRPGRLRVRVEYERPWPAETLAQLVCHHLWRLQSPVIEGIHLVAAPVGQRGCLWERRIRLKRSQFQKPTRPSRPLPPYLRQRMRPSSRVLGQSVEKSSPQGISRPWPDRHLASPSSPLSITTKMFRALLLSGSAVAAFLLGCWVEVRRYQQETSPTVVSQQVTRFSAETRVAGAGAGVPVVYARQGGGGAPLTQRPRVIQGALEPLMVIAHPPRQPGEAVTLVFGGQVDFGTLPTTVLQSPEPLLAEVAAYQGADLAMVSLNTSLATAATSLQENYLDRQRPEVAAQLHQSGVDVVDLAAEGSLSFGAQGLGETLQALDRQGVYRVGAGRTELEARRPEIIEVKGQRIAYLSYSQRDWLRAQGERAGVNGWTEDSLRADVAALRPQVDWVVVSYRWKEADGAEGAEWVEPSEWQRTAAHLAVEAGADVVIGHHPQGLQGAELYQGRPIVYSLGTLVGGTSPGRPEQAGVLLQMTLAPQQLQVALLPVAVRQGRPYQVEGPEGSEILQALYRASQGFPQPMAPAWTVALEPVAPAVPPIATPAVAQPSPAPAATPAVNRSAGSEVTVPEETVPEAIAPPTPAPLLLPEPPRLDNWGPKLSEEEEAFFPIPAGESTPASGPMVAPSGPEASPPGSFVAPASGETLEFMPPPAYTPPEARAWPAAEPADGGPSGQAVAPEPLPAPVVAEDDPVMDARSRLGHPQTRVFHPQEPLSPEPTATTL